MAVLLRTGMAIAAALVAACQTPDLTQEEMGSGTPAVLSNPSPETTAELTEVIMKATHGRKTILAADVLTTSASLAIELAPRGSMNGDYMMGRRMDKPEHFSLSKSGKHCILTHKGTGTHYALSKAKCEVIT